MEKKSKEELLWLALKSSVAPKRDSENTQYGDGYRHAIRDIVDGVEELLLEIQDPSGEYTAYYPAHDVLERLLDMALNTPDGPQPPQSVAQRRERAHALFCSMRPRVSKLGEACNAHAIAPPYGC